MSITYKYIIPSLAVMALTASVAVAQMAPGGAMGPMRGDRTPPTAEQRTARQTEMCADRMARGAARLTYMEERLSLTPAQKPLFERWKAAVQSENAARRADCAKPRAAAEGKRPTLPERNARMEEMLKTRLATLQKTRPAEEALYNALTPEQKSLLEGRGRGGPRMGARRFGGRNGGRGPGGPGPRGGI